MKKILIYGVLISTIFFCGSCSKDFLFSTPTEDTSKESILTSIKNLDMALQGIHRRLISTSNNGFAGEPTFNLWGDYLGGVTVRPNRNSNWYIGVYDMQDIKDYTKDLTYMPWRFRYIIIKNANEIIAAVDKLKGSTEAEEKLRLNIKAQALAYRAYCYLNLGQLYAEAWVPGGENTQLAVPLKVTPEAELLPRASLKDIYKQVMDDVNGAIAIFEAADDTYKNFGKKHQKNNLGSAASYMIKARLFMVQGLWDEALAESEKIIAMDDTYQIMGYDKYSNGFSGGVRDNNPEWIWGSLITSLNNPGWASYYAYMSYDYGTASFVSTNPNMIVSTVQNKIPVSDKRSEIFLSDTDAEIETNLKTNKSYYFDNGWTSEPTATVTRGISRKYATATGAVDTSGDMVYMRLAEAYYIAAEAAYMAGNQTKAAKYLEATVTPYDEDYEAISTGADLLAEIKNYKFFDMYGEGRSWEDYKRRGDKVDRNNSNHKLSVAVVMEYQRGGVNDYCFKFVVPRSALNNNPNLVP